MVLHTLFLTVMQRTKLIYKNFYLSLKTLALHNVIILIKSVFNKGQSHYYYNILLHIAVLINYLKMQIINRFLCKL